MVRKHRATRELLSGERFLIFSNPFPSLGRVLPATDFPVDGIGR